MKRFSIKVLIFVLSLLISGILSCIQFLFFSQEIFSLVVNGLLIFILSFLIFMLIVKKNMDEKAKDIFNTIRKYRSVGDKKLPELNLEGDLLDELKKEVLAWAEDRKNEIEQLKKLETYRKEFLGNVSHELKTPIFNIQGYILTLLDGGIDDPKINRDYLARAENSVERMISIVEDLEAITQYETGELHVEMERFDIIPLLKDIIDSQEMRATAKGIILSVINGENPIWVYADRFRIRQVLTNLIVNSVNYGRDYGETKVKFTDLPGGHNVLIEVADNGIGIGQDHLPRIFERFYRVDKSRSRDQGGTGLGLAIVKHIVEAHSQTINVTSKVGVGSTFFFTLRKAV